ncbi:MAG: Hpt domain-containing protein [Planctomycetota bacterium]
MQSERDSHSPLELRHDDRLGGGPILDRDAFAALEELAGLDDPDLVAEIVELYLDDSLVRVSEVESGRRSSEFGRIGSAAHALKSASANIGALTFSEACADLEAATRVRGGVDLDEIERLCDRAMQMYAEVRTALGLLDCAD